MTQPSRHGVAQAWVWAVPVAAAALLAAKYGGLVPPALILIPAALLLFGTVFSAVHHAEEIALRVGEPFGSIILAIAVTVIEVALIASIMLSAPESTGTVARDTVFATVMIAMNGVVGLCLILGGARHREQNFNLQGAIAALSVLGTLAVITMVLPNYARAAPGPVYSNGQMAFVGFVSLFLYGMFVFVQTVRHREYFSADASHGHPVPSATMALVSLGLLILSLICVVLLAKTLSPALEAAVASAGLPAAFVGVVIAAIVLLPEGTAAVKAARANNLQTSLNLALGGALATIGLTIPALAAVSIWLGHPLTLGLAEEEMTLLVLTLFISTVTLAAGRTTILQGAVHLVIFGVFLFLSAVP